MAHILIITTGGTITSVKEDTGLGLGPASSKIILEALKHIDNTNNYELKELFTLDSTNIQPEEWQKLASEINDNVNKFDGIIVTHGTDTMAYTTSILSFILQNPPLPIVFTGSQLPIYDPLTDAYSNLRYALCMAKSKIGGIFLAFNRKIILGCRAVKVRTSSFHAFESINSENVASIDARGLTINPKFIHQQKEYLYKNQIETNVFLLKLTPNMDPAIIEVLLQHGIKGLIIEAYGAGGISFMRRNFLEYLKKLTNLNIPVCVCSQCLYEESNFNIYEVGKRALEIGVIEAFDMTSEACLTKLMWALGQTADLAQIKKYFRTNLVGEIKESR